LTARGRPQKEFQMQVITAVFAIVVYRIAVVHSVYTLAWMVPIIYLLRYLLLTTAVLREVGGKWIDLISTCWPSAILLCVSVAAAKTFERLSSHVQPFPRLLLVGTGTAVIVLVAFGLLSNWLLKPIMKKMPQLASLLPKRLKFLIVH